MNATSANRVENFTYVALSGLSLTRVGVLGTVTSLSTCAAAYIVAVLINYEWMSYKSKKPLIVSQNRKKSQNTKYGALMRVSALSAAIFGLITFLSQMFQIFFDLDSKLVFCDALKKIDFTVTNFIFISVYAVLWLRQRSFYINKNTLHLTSCCTRCFSIVLLILLFAISLINPIVYDTTQFYMRTNYGCKLRWSAFPTQYHWMTLAIVTIFFHASLLILFAYPLLKHRAAINQRVSKQSGNRKTNELVAVIRRAFHLAIVCVVSDVIVVVVNVAVVTVIDITPQIVTNINLLTNITCVIMTFGDWKQRLFPWVKTRSEDKRNERSSMAMLQTSLRDRSTTDLQEQVPSIQRSLDMVEV